MKHTDIDNLSFYEIKRRFRKLEIINDDQLRIISTYFHDDQIVKDKKELSEIKNIVEDFNIEGGFSVYNRMHLGDIGSFFYCNHISLFFKVAAKSLLKIKKITDDIK